MSAKQTPPQNVTAYIAMFPADVQAILEQIRTTVMQAAPDAEELIRYGMPAYKLNGKLVDFAAFKKHIGFYPRMSAIEHFKAELAPYRSERGTVQFPIDRAIPYKLIGEMVKFRAKENLAQSENEVRGSAR